MIITRVVKKDDTNVIVYLDNNEKLYLSYEVFLRNGLRKDLEKNYFRKNMIKKLLTLFCRTW